jgi:hypothetical protein
MTYQHTCSVIFLAASLIPRPTPAQQQIHDLAQPGVKGILVHLGSDLLTPNNTRSKGVAYRVERRLGQSGEWAVVGEVTAPISAEEFRERLTAAMSFLPDPPDVSKLPAGDLWETIRRYGRIDSLGFWSGVLPVRIAAGAAYADLDVAPHTAYQYRVTILGSGGGNLLTFRSSTVSFPGSPTFPPIRLVDKRSNPEGISLRWVVDQKPKPTAYQVYRRDGFGGNFETSGASRVILTDRSATFIVVQDTATRPNGIYSYYLVPLDYYGNPGLPSDTAMVAASSVQSLVLPRFLRAESNDSLGGILLSWQMPLQESVRSIRIFKSEQFDSAFAAIAEIPASDSMLVDLDVDPMVKYVYYLSLVGPLGETSPPSAKFFGIFETARQPMPPLNLRAEQNRNGVRLRWPGSDDFLKGYYVYRTDGLSDSLIVLSPLIPAKDSLVTFTDTSVTRGGRMQYGYAIRSENTSHRQSMFSDTVWVSSPAGAIPVPTGLRGYAEEGHAVLYWDDLYANDESVDGYLIHRRERQSGTRNWSAFLVLPDTVPAEQNHFTDMTVISDRSYEYAVQTLGFPEGASHLGGTIQLHVDSPVPPAPAGLTAVKADGEIVLRWNAVEDPVILRTNIYRYERGQKPILAGFVSASEEPEFSDKKVRKGALYFYYLTSVSKPGKESSPGKEIGIRP